MKMNGRKVGIVMAALKKEREKRQHILFYHGEPRERSTYIRKILLVCE